MVEIVVPYPVKMGELDTDMTEIAPGVAQDAVDFGVGGEGWTPAFAAR